MSQNPTKHTKVLIIGSGPAGFTAAVYAARAMLKPILVHGMEPGGQLTTTTDVENFPGFAEVIQGPWLMDQMRDQAKAVGTEMIEDHIASVKLKSKPFEAVGDGAWSFKLQIKPFIRWIWFGAILIALGTFVSSYRHVKRL